RVTRENKTWQRILTAAWILTTVILTWSYCSNLTSQMTVLYTSHPYQTAEDFIQDTEAVLYVETDTADAQILKDENNFILTAMITGQPLVLLLDDLTSQVIMGQHFSQT
ncbi:putative olfactory ionotropic receptor IR4-like 26, partial [Homarus americanus]